MLRVRVPLDAPIITIVQYLERRLIIDTLISVALFIASVLCPLEDIDKCTPLPLDVPEVQEVFMTEWLKSEKLEEIEFYTPYDYPEYITVRVTGKKRCYSGIPYHIEEVNFKDYVKGVIVSEFGTCHWVYDERGDRDKCVPHTTETLHAIAMAVKNYSLYHYSIGGKWGGYEYGIVFDCNWDQVFNPAMRSQETDKAVDDTWNLIFLDYNFEIKPGYYGSWRGEAIEASVGTPDYLTAWGKTGVYSQGDAGWTMEEMLYAAYNDIIIIEVNVE